MSRQQNGKEKAPLRCVQCPYAAYADELRIFCGVCILRIAAEEYAARRTAKEVMDWEK